MIKPWYIEPNELTTEQKQAILLPYEGNYLLTGPAGSGKTNIAMLRTKAILKARASPQWDQKGGVMRGRYDEGWKEVIETFFPQFLRFFFPRIAQGIDFGKSYAFLDKELGRISKKGLGRRRVDKLVRVYRKNGDEQWLLMHIEVQGYPQKEFERRMYVYNYRIFDRYNRDVVSLAVLTDEDERFRPGAYRFGFGGFRWRWCSLW